MDLNSHGSRTDRKGRAGGGLQPWAGTRIAEELAREGTRLVMCARGADDLHRTRDRIARASGSEPVAVAADLTDPRGRAPRHRCRQRSLRKRRHPRHQPPAALPPAPSRRTLRRPGAPPSPRTSRASSTSRAPSLPGMRERGWGRIINVTSIAVKQPVDGLILSNSVRAAVTGFARTLANEVARDGVTVNNVMPGYTRTARLDWLAGQNRRTRGHRPGSRVRTLGQRDPRGPGRKALRIRRSGYLSRFGARELHHRHFHSRRRRMDRALV